MSLFAIFYGSLNPLKSIYSGSDNLLVINLDSANPSISTYSNLVAVTPAGAPVPEPATMLLLGSGLLGLVGLRRKFKK